MTNGGRDVGGGKLERTERILRDDIESGRLRDGEVLPSTRALAGQMGVSVWTVNKAMELLAEDGLIESKPGSRRIVRNNLGRAAEPGTARMPRTFLIGGHAGSGKSELGRVLARLAGSAIIDKDTITRHVTETLLETLGRPPHDRESRTYLDQVRPLETEAVLSVIQENANAGVGVIGTAPFVSEFQDNAWIDRVSARLRTAGVDLTLVWVRCDAATMRTYLQRRGAARDMHKLAHWDDHVAALDLDYRPTADHVIVDNSATAEPLQRQAARMLAAITETAERP
ncbi:GntR family transcriptional regulator [Promicromonospora sp. NPDC057138]|uniref:GntR family transcriptional regulator n=1 Tax=Promicromonospora sp. NPDC057138 TaxID=3346031 RepID=UPI003628D479